MQNRYEVLENEETAVEEDEVIYFMFLTIYTRPHKLEALIFIVFK